MTQHSTSEIDGQAAGHMLTDLKVLTGAGAILSASHRDREGNLHGHTWEVRAWWQEGACAVERQRELTSYLSLFDHTILADELAWAESLAKSICLGLHCSKVEVSRPLERLFASVELAA